MNRNQSNRSPTPVNRTGIPGVREKGGSRKTARWVVTLLIAFILLPIMPVTRTAAAEIDAADVQRSIDRGVAYLRKSQNDVGGWGQFNTFRGGVSSLCTLAMLNAGVPKDDPAIVRALGYLRRIKPQETYSIALQTLVFCQVGSATDLPRIRNNVEILSALQRPSGQWSYGAMGAQGSGDPSNSQFALLALGAAVDRGIEVEPIVFERALADWIGSQRRNGGWAYDRGDPRTTGSMTCAGIAAVIISQGRLSGTTSSISGDQIVCCGGEGDKRGPVEAALTYMGRVFSASVNPNGRSENYYYYMYALERAGRLSGRRFIGGHDWYREGAERLVALQDSFEGFWVGKGNSESYPDIATSFALLFLSKGKRQVVVSRLKHGGNSRDWNQHPDGLRQLVRHVQRQWGRDLTWQTTDLETATVEDLLQSPVTVISGRDTFSATDQQTQRLQQYIEQGGTIVVEVEGGDGCGNAIAFRDSVVPMIQGFFPGAKLEKLPPEHPVWFAQRKVDPLAIGPRFWIFGVQACCRTPVFVVPTSLSCRWELSADLFSGRPLPPKVQLALQSSVAVGENIIAYATGRELADKLQQRTLLGGDRKDGVQRGSLEIAELAVGAGGKDAGRALANAVGLISQRVPMSLDAVADPIDFDKETFRNVPMLWMHGRTDFILTGQQRDLLRSYLQNGGFILANAICGSDAFTTAFRRELAAIDPKLTLRALPADSVAFTNSLGGFDVRSVTIRQPAVGTEKQEITRRRSAPRIEVATTDGVANVFFSPLDLSCAMESQNSVQCPGYSTDDSARIIANILLFALQQ